MQNKDQVLSLLKKKYPKTKYYLNFSNPFELCVAAILSAQCRDTVVNATTEKLFKKYKTPLDFTHLDEKDITAITFFRAKTAHIRKMSDMIITEYEGKVPQSTEALTELPGIGKKTANAIMQNAFGIVEGVVVDTHVIRVSYRLDWTKQKDPKKIEQDLMRLFDKKEWKKLPHLLKDHGRAVCKAPTPECSHCVLNKLCPKHGVTKEF